MSNIDRDAALLDVVSTLDIHDKKWEVSPPRIGALFKRSVKPFLLLGRQLLIRISEYSVCMPLRLDKVLAYVAFCSQIASQSKRGDLGRHAHFSIRGLSCFVLSEQLFAYHQHGIIPECPVIDDNE
jgi:hypothetical protein